MTAPVYTRHFWAKSDRANPQRIHLLEHHMADVGACLEALLAQRTIRRRLARSGGRDDLDPATIARLCVFAALHDIGKVNVGFQARIWQPEDLPTGEAKRPRRAGHIADLTPVLNQDDRETAAWFFDALGWDDFLAWDAEDGRSVCGLFVAALSHHGSPLNLNNTRQRNSSIWRSYGALNPQRQVTRIGQSVREWVSRGLVVRRTAASINRRLPAPVHRSVHAGRLDRLGRNPLPVLCPNGRRLYA